MCSSAQLSYVWSILDSPLSGPRADSPLSEIRVAVNDWVNDLLVLRAEVSRLDEHLVKVPSSVFAWRVGFYDKPHWSIYANDVHVRHQRLQILGWFFVADIIYNIGRFFWRLLAIVIDSGNPGFALPDRLHINLFLCCCIFP